MASNPTVSRTSDVLAADPKRAMSAIDAARAQARAAVWSAAGVHASDRGANADAPVVIDLDAALISAHGAKANAASTWKNSLH